MERLNIMISLLCYFYFIIIIIIPCSHAIESPTYTVLRSALDVEIRLYTESSWISALVQPSTSFDKSTEDGFHRLYQYIHGDNVNSSRLKMTAPVLTTINRTAADGPPNYSVNFYLPKQYEAAPPQPFPELNLKIQKWRSHCIAAKKFSGFAKDDNIDKERESLVSSLDKLLSNNGKNATAVLEDKNSYGIAQYNASFHLSGRLNEVWMNIVSVEGCPLY